MTTIPSGDANDLILLTGIRAFGRHGVLAQERATGQDFVVDLALHVPSVAEAARTDDLARTVSYATVAQAVVDVVEGPPVDLIETLADRIAQVCLQDAKVHRVTVTVHKPQAPIPVPFADVAVQLTRSR